MSDEQVRHADQDHETITQDEVGSVEAVLGDSADTAILNREALDAAATEAPVTPEETKAPEAPVTPEETEPATRHSKRSAP